MKVSEILHQLADLVDQTENMSGAEQEAGMPQQPGMDQEAGMDQQASGETGSGEITITQLEPVDVCGDDGTEPETMVSPLQQEHELLKKSQGVDNNVDEFAGDESGCDMGHDQANPEEMTGQPDNGEDEQYNEDIARMKQIAGIGEESNGPHNYAEDIKPVSINPRAEAAKQFHRNRNANK